jgi:hypothetical protein
MVMMRPRAVRLRPSSLAMRGARGAKKAPEESLIA